MRMWTVYSAINKITGDQYIGVTGRSLEYRKKRHLYKARRNEMACPKFYAAIIKYGPSSFKWEALAQFSIKEFAYHHEFVLVQKMRPKYNSAPGGGIGPDEPWNKKSVICLEDGVVYESATCAAAAYDADNSEISKNCNGKKASVKGRHFRYCTKKFSEAERKELIAADKAFVMANMRRVRVRKDDGTRSIESGIDRHGIRRHGLLKSCRQVICLDDGKVFYSASEAARAYDLNKSGVIETCLGRRAFGAVGGKHFSYVENVGQRWVA